MGNRASSFFVRKDPDGSKSKAIDKALKQEEKRMKTEAKILLLGKIQQVVQSNIYNNWIEKQKTKIAIVSRLLIVIIINY